MLASEAQDAPNPVSAAETSASTAGWFSLFRAGNALISFMISGGVAIHAMSMRVVATALPSVVTEIGGLSFFAWTTTVAIVSAIWGAAFVASLVRIRGLRDAYRISLLLFAAGSIACAVSPNMAIFLGGRLFQGFGGGLLTGLAYTTIRRVFPENLRTRAIVFLSGIWGVAAFSAPAAGGVLAGWGLWRWAFWIDVPFAIAVGLLAQITLSKSVSPEPGDVAVQPFTVCARLALLTGSALAVSVGSLPGKALPSGIGLVLGMLLLIALLRVEHSPGEAPTFRLLPSGAYRPGNVLGAVSLTMALMSGSTTAAVLYVPYVATEAGGYPPIVGGYLSALLALAWTCAAFLTASAEGVWVERSIILGPATICLGLVLTAYALIHGPFFFMAFGIGLAGTGVGMAWAHLSNLMMAHARKAEHDVSSAFIYTNQMIAGAFASALAGMIANLAGFADRALGPSAIIQSVAWVFLSFSALAAAAIPVSILAVRRSTVLRPAPQQRAVRTGRRPKS
jgi:MFS family permease